MQSYHRNFRLGIFVVLLFLLGVVFSNGGPYTRVVNTTAACAAASDSNYYYETIQSAIDAALNRDTIIVCQNGSGVYSENVNISKKINLYGNESNVRVVAASASDDVFGIYDDYVNISNFSVSGAIGVDRAGIYLGGANYSSITQLSIHSSDFGIYLDENSQYNSISSNTIYNNSEAGIFITGSSSSSNRIFSNTIYNHTVGLESGIYLDHVNGINYIYDNPTIQNNTLGVYVHYSNSTNITNNSFDLNGWGIYVEVGNNTQVSDSFIYNTSDDAIFLYNATSSNIDSIEISSSTDEGDDGAIYVESSSVNFNNITINLAEDAGFFFINSSSNSITNSTLKGSTYGVLILNSNYTNVSNCTIYNNADAGISIGANCSNNRIFSNTIRNHTAGLASGVYLSLVNNINYIYNNPLIELNTYGVYLNYSNYTSVYNNSVSGGESGFYSLISGYNNFTNNTASGGSGSGFYIQGGDYAGHYNSVLNNTAYGYTFYGVTLYSSDNNSVSLNTIRNNGVYNVWVADSGDNNISSNTIYTAQAGVYLQYAGSSGNRIYSNNIYSHTSGMIKSGIYLNTVGYNYIYNNPIIDNNTYNIYVYQSNLSILTNNTLRFGTIGIILYDSKNNTLNSNTIINSSSSGISISGSGSTGSLYNYIANGSVYNVSDDSIFVYGQSNTIDSMVVSTPRDASSDGTVYVSGNSNTFNNITIDLAGSSGFYIEDDIINNVFTSNKVRNTTNGFYFAPGSYGNNLSSNNASNNSVSQYYFNNANATFTGNNYATNMPTGALLMQISGGGVVTAKVGSTYYSLITDHLNFSFVNATDVTLQNTTSNLTQAEVSDTTCVDSGYTCQLVSDGILYVTNNSASANITELVIYYNSSKLGSHSASAIQLSNYSSGWVQLGATEVNTTNSYVRHGSFSSFSKFAAVAFSVASSSSSVVSSGSSVSHKYPDLAKTFDCSKGELTISATSGLEISGMNLKLFNTKDFSYVQKATDSNGKAVFTITKDGKYEVDSESTNAYLSTTLGPFDLALCSETTTAPTPPTTSTTVNTSVTEVVVVKEKQEEEPIVTSTLAKDEALASISAADAAISSAYKAGKDVTDARKKLDAANEALATGNYDEASKLTLEAIELAKNAKAKPVATTISTATPTQKPTTQPVQQGMDLGTIIVVIAVIVIVVLGIYYFVKGKSSKGYKGQRKI